MDRPEISDPARLAAVRDLDLLDSAPTTAFDRLTELTAVTLEVPMAAITLVEETRQFFVSAIGLPRDVARARETCIDVSHCRHVVERDAPVVLEDTRAAASVMPVPGIRAYAGMPLRTPEGLVLGALCVMDVTPRRWTARELRMLEAVSTLAMGEIEMHSAGRRLYAAARDDLSRSREETIWRLTGAIEARSGDTGAHAERMSHTCAVLAERMGMDSRTAELIRIASPLHDVGKIAIPDLILNKPGSLEPGEREVMQAHAMIGHRMLAGSREPLLELGALIALTHHERIDGRGYPHGVAGEAIPIEGRIAAVADVFDALTNDRVYRPAFALDEALAMIDAGRGTQFDPRVVTCLREGLPDILAAAGGDSTDAGENGTRARDAG